MCFIDICKYDEEIYEWMKLTHDKERITMVFWSSDISKQAKWEEICSGQIISRSATWCAHSHVCNIGNWRNGSSVAWEGKCCLTAISISMESVDLIWKIELIHAGTNTSWDCAIKMQDFPLCFWYGAYFNPLIVMFGRNWLCKNNSTCFGCLWVALGAFGWM